ncbi:hypothetical protein GHT06_008730 [Daphnia sinensis]|uniref:Protein dead ringer n=1 Tax=Daphnia sinensis TaxID=1820382 RepID=A0AAD5Q0Y1_9CRUS|nr:hypothetical protein GHT06_008730 [Daphnia sinensis]
MLLSPGSAENVSKIRVKNREPVPSYRMDRNDDEIDAMMSDGEGDSSDNLDRDDSSDDGDLDDGVGNDQLKRQDGGDMDQEMQVHQALLRQAEAAAHMQTLMQSQLGLSIGSGFPNLANFPGMAGLGGLHPDLQAQLQAHIQALSGGGGQAGQQGTGNGTSNGHSSNESQSPPAGMGPPKTSSPLSGLNNASQNSLLSLANSSHHSMTTPASSPYNNNKQRHHSNAAISPARRGNGQQHHHNSKDSKDDDQDSLDGSSSPSPPASMLASIAAAASALRSPSGGLLPPSSAASHHPYLASAFSNALGGLSALTSGLSVGGSNGGAHGSSAGGQHPPLTPSPSSDSPQQTDAPRGAPNSSQQSWTFEEQFKQLYELNDDAGRKAFLDELFDFMQKRGTPITRLPIMAKQVLDLYELYNLVVARGGLVDVINKKLWQEIIKGLHLPSSITSAAFTLRTQYMKYLYPYECEKEKYSSPNELQAAIDGNRREGRRSSYGAYADLVPRGNGGGGGGGSNGGGGGSVSGAAQHAASLSALASHMSHMSPLSLVSRPSALNGNGHHHRPGSDSPPSQSPHEALAELNMSRIHLWNIYNSLGGDVGGDMAAAMAAASRFLPQTAATAGTGSSGSQPPQTEALNLAAEQHAAAQAAAAAAAAAARTLELNKENKDKDRESSGHKSRRERKEEEREKRDRDRSYEIHEDRSQSSIRIKEESLMQDGPPANKRLLLDDDVSLNMRMTPIGLPGANIKITSRGDTRTNDNSLVVSMEINGIVYQGVLFAQAAAAAAAATAALTPARGRLA